MMHGSVVTNDASIHLNILRVVAAELVVFGHLFWWWYGGHPLIAVASFGVVLFFALSGLLISNSVFSKSASRHYAFREYFIDRFARIYSGLIPALLLVVIIDGLHIIIFPEHWASYVEVVGRYSVSNFIGSRSCSRTPTSSHAS